MKQLFESEDLIKELIDSKASNCWLVGVQGCFRIKRSSIDMSKVIQNICDVVGKAYFCLMETEISSIFYHAPAFEPKAEMPMRLMIDASKRGEPYFGLFNLSN